jgi:hypothetical protein
MYINKSKLNVTYILFTLLAVFIVDVLNYLNFSQNNFGLKSYFTLFLSYISFFLVFRYYLKSRNKFRHLKNNRLFNIWLFYVAISLIRGFFLASNYWDYKFLFVSAFGLTFICTIFYLGQNMVITKKIITFYVKKILPLSLIILPLTYLISEQLFSRLVMPVGYLLVFIPYLKKKWRLFFILIICISILSNIGARTNIIKYVISILTLSLYYVNFFLRPFFLKIFLVLIVLIPVILFSLGLTNNYNIFNEFSNIEIYNVEDTNSGTLKSQTTDTRTFLYQEVMSDLINNNSLIFGKSPSKGYFTNAFYDFGGAIENTRYKTEVNILNIFLFYGFFGVILYLLLLISICSLGLFKSKNRLAKMLAILLGSHLLISFIAESTTFNINIYFFWLFLGLVASKPFRTMDEHQIKLWVRGILNKSYNQNQPS